MTNHMHLKSISVCLTVITTYVSCVSATNNGTVDPYEELIELHAACRMYDRCPPDFDDTLDVRSCICGEKCIEHNTCCINSEFRDKLDDLKQESEEYDCFTIYGTQSYFMVTKCDSKFRGDPLVKSLCETKTNSIEDPVVLTPTTNRKSNVTYSNYFCAMCNDDLEELEFWKLEISKQEREDYDKREKLRIDPETIMERVIYNEESGQWGFYLDTNDTQEEMSFEEVSLNYKAPEDAHHADACIPDLISNCDELWVDEVVRQKCRSYMAAILVTLRDEYYEYDDYSDAKKYRNIHCAICNFIGDDYDKRCIEREGVGYGGVARPPLAFSLLLDVNPKDGNTVGRVNRCGRGETYDPFFKKCRMLVCALPGTRMVDGKCVQS